MIFFQMFSAAKVVLFCELRKFFRYFFQKQVAKLVSFCLISRVKLSRPEKGLHIQQ